MYNTAMDAYNNNKKSIRYPHNLENHQRFENIFIS